MSGISPDGVAVIFTCIFKNIKIYSFEFIEEKVIFNNEIVVHK